MKPEPAPPDAQALLAHAGWVRALARSLVLDDQRADDVVQQTWLAALEHPPRPGVPLRAWLAAVARNFSLRTLRAEGRRARHEAAAPPRGPEPGPDETMERAETFRRVVDAVLGVEEPYRSALLLRYFEGLEPAAIARRQGVPPETVRTRIRRGLERVRESLDRKHGGDRRRWALLLLPLPGAAGPGTPRGIGVSAAAGPLVLGGALMAKKAFAAAAAILVVAAGTWMWSRREDPAPSVAGGPRSGEIASAPASGSPDTPPPPPAAAPAPRAAAGPRITGRVVDRSGAPVPGARITSCPASYPGSVLGGDPDDLKGPSRSSRADGAGRFAIPVPEGASSCDVLAVAEGSSATLAAGLRAGDDVTLTLRPPCTLSGTVRDLDGQPVAGATVRWLTPVAAFRVERSGTSDAAGAYEVRGIPSPWSLRDCNLHDRFGSLVEVRAEGFASLAMAGLSVKEDRDGNRRLDLYLARGATVRGRVVDAEAGTPLAGARVVAWSNENVPSVPLPDGGWRENPHGRRLLAEARSGTDGEFSLPGLPSWGVHPVGIHTADPVGRILGYATAEAEGVAGGSVQLMVPSEGETVDVEIRCWPEGAVRGRVLDATGRPVPGATVSVFPPTDRLLWRIPSFDGRPPSPPVTAADGTYRIEGVAGSRREPVPARVVARAPGAPPFDPGATVEVAVAAGAVATAPDIVLGPALPSVVVRVADAAGNPVPGAEVVGGGAGEPTLTRTDAEGRARVFFRASPQGPEAPVTIPVMARGYARVHAGPVTPSPVDPPEVRVVLAKGRRVRGRILFADGTPAGGVALDVLDGSLPLDRLRGSPREIPPSAQYGGGTAGEDGGFDVEGLPEGPYHLTSYVSRPAPAGAEIPWIRAEAIAVPAGAEGIELRFAEAPPVPRSGTLEATIADARTGRPVLRWYAMIQRADVALMAKACAPGKFRMEDLASGAWSLRVRAPGYKPFARGEVFVPDGGAPEAVSVLLEPR